MANTYKQGQIDGIQLWGSTCSRQANCEDCLIHSVKGEELSCQEFATQFPSKFLSLISEMSSNDYTYFDEYVTRFPQCNLSVEDLSKCACRKAIFEGYTECDETNCEECWKETYVGDVTEINDDIENI